LLHEIVSWAMGQPAESGETAKHPGTASWRANFIVFEAIRLLRAGGRHTICPIIKLARFAAG